MWKEKDGIQANMMSSKAVISMWRGDHEPVYNYAFAVVFELGEFHTLCVSGRVFKLNVMSTNRVWV